MSSSSELGKEIETTKAKFEKLVDSFAETNDPNERTARLNLLTALQSERNILLQGEAARLQAVEGPTSCLKVAPPDTQVADAYARVDRLLHETETIGTCVRLEGGVVIAARHCVVADGRCLQNLTAFNGQLQFIGARADIDVAVFKGAIGSSFQLAPANAVLGQAVQLLSHPLAYDVELKLEKGSSPAMDAGVVSQISETGTHAAATFGTGMPNSSGGAVVGDTRTLVGLYLGTIWHLERPSEGNNSGSGGSYNSAPPTTIEVDPNNLWDEEESGPLEQAATCHSMAAELSLVNIPHKSSAGLFVLAPTLRQFLVALGLAGQAPLSATAGLVARNKKRPARTVGVGQG